MRFHTENLSPRVLRAVNLPVLENIICRFLPPHGTGKVTLTTTQLQRHLRLEFSGDGDMEGMELRSGFLSEELLLQPSSVSDLISTAAEFLAEIWNHRAPAE